MLQRCQYAAPGTYGHECGDLATNVLITQRTIEAAEALRCMGVAPSADGLCRSRRCEAHRGMREISDGRAVRTEELVIK